MNSVYPKINCPVNSEIIASQMCLDIEIDDLCSHIYSNNSLFRVLATLTYQRFIYVDRCSIFVPVLSGMMDHKQSQMELCTQPSCPSIKIHQTTHSYFYYLFASQPTKWPQKKNVVFIISSEQSWRSAVLGNKCLS